MVVDYKQAWEDLRKNLMARGEYVFFAKGDDKYSIYVGAEIAIRETLNVMNELDHEIDNPSSLINVLPMKKSEE